MSAKRVNLSTKEKLKLIERIENGEIKKTVANDFKVGYSTASALVKEKDKLLALAQTRHDVKRAVQPKFKTVDEAVSLWFNEMRTKNVPMSGEMLKTKAKEYAEQLNIVGFAEYVHANMYMHTCIPNKLLIVNYIQYISIHKKNK